MFGTFWFHMSAVICALNPMRLSPVEYGSLPVQMDEEGAEKISTVQEAADMISAQINSK